VDIREYPGDDADGLSDDQLPVIWRTKLRSTLHHDHAGQVAHCLKKRLVGIGWWLEDLPSGTPLDTILHRVASNPAPGWGLNAAANIRRLGRDAQVGEFIWTRDTYGRYLLGRISGPYRYDASKVAIALDVVQTRRVDWAPEPLNDLDVPGGVIRSFVGTSQSFSRIWDEGARRFTPHLWAKLTDRPLPNVAIRRAEILKRYLDPYDVEDLVYVWLQVRRGWVAMPRSRQRDTPAYEWTMVSRETGRRGITQIKTGNDPVDLAALAAARADNETDTFAFAACGYYLGDESLVTEVIQPKDLLRFAQQQPSLLPPRVRNWFALAKGLNTSNGAELTQDGVTGCLYGTTS
jgi:hypothetical protein